MNPGSEPEAPGILVVEDRAIVAAKVRRELERAGLRVAAVVATCEAAERLAETLPLGAAVLDLDLRGEPVFPVARALRRRRVPFVFLTGYSHVALPTAWQDVHHVEKPFEAAVLLRALAAAIRCERAPAMEERLVTPAIRRAWDRVRHSRDLVTEQRAWAEQFGRNTGVD